MLDYSELTIVKNSEGMPTALGYPINSILLQNNKPLFAGGGGSKSDKSKIKKVKSLATGQEDEGDEPITSDFNELAVPAGLVCMTQTICQPADSYANAYTNAYDIEEPETIPEGLYEQLLALAETKPPKKLSKRKALDVNKKKGHKTVRRK
jgi:hypothetical protein